MLKIEFSTGNAAFQDEEGYPENYNKKYEIIRILSKISKQVDFGYSSGSIMDSNGNKVGEWSLD